MKSEPQPASFFQKRPVSAHPASEFLNRTRRNWPQPRPSFYLQVSMSRNDPAQVDGSAESLLLLTPSTDTGARCAKRLVNLSVFRPTFQVPGTSEKNNCVARTAPHVPALPARFSSSSHASSLSFRLIILRLWPPGLCAQPSMVVYVKLGRVGVRVRR